MKALPKWAIDDARSVEEEAAPYRSMTDAERLRCLTMACRSGWKLLRARDDWRAVLEFVDPIPESGERALARLRAAARRHP